MRKVILIAHDLRSTHNVGSLLRTAEGLGVETVFFTGYSPYPRVINDERLPHITDKLDRQIQKTALGAEKLMNWRHHENIFELIKELKKNQYLIVALEQDQRSIELNKSQLKGSTAVAVVVGNEVKGLDKNILDAVDSIVEIPMRGSKESLNVVQAAAIVAYVFTT
ncbi:MAG TPA: TrmH family RNA methyltransferase [Candidatus Saccharimonadales bacterium]|nr:TrmH family RNA methyltransferase [Candidatus Saccharimonadales bacterium]